MTIDQLLHAASIDGSLSRLEARILFAAACGRSREWVVAHGLDFADIDSAALFKELVARRGRGEPIAYLTGAREFFGRRFEVSPAVLIPRPETELLVEVALERIAPLTAPRVLDLGTGSGVLAVTLALERPDAVVTATDISAPALAIAGRNAANLGAEVRFRAGDWWQALAPAKPIDAFDLIVSNPPYIADADPHLSHGDLRFEPRGALCSGPQGDDDLRALIAAAVPWLRPGGWLALEHGFEQGDLCRRLMRQHDFREVATRADLEHRERVTVGTPG